jgi:hypothetical protein
MLRRIFVPLAIATICGCSGIDHASLDAVKPMPDTSNLSTSGGQMHTGIATAFKPRVWTHDLWGSHEQSSGIDVRSSDTTVLEAAPATSDSQHVVWAVGAGTADLQVTYNDEVALHVTVVVTDPP